MAGIFDNQSFGTIAFTFSSVLVQSIYCFILGDDTKGQVEVWGKKMEQKRFEQKYLLKYRIRVVGSTVYQVHVKSVHLAPLWRNGSRHLKVH